MFRVPFFRKHFFTSGLRYPILKGVILSPYHPLIRRSFLLTVHKAGYWEGKMKWNTSMGNSLKPGRVQEGALWLVSWELSSALLWSNHFISWLSAQQLQIPSCCHSLPHLSCKLSYLWPFICGTQQNNSGFSWGLQSPGARGKNLFFPSLNFTAGTRWGAQ